MFTTISETQADQLVNQVRKTTGDATDYVLYDVLLGERTCLGVVTSDIATATDATVSYLKRCGLEDRWSGLVLKQPHGAQHHLLVIPGIAVARSVEG